MSQATERLIFPIGRDLDREAAFRGWSVMVVLDRTVGDFQCELLRLGARHDPLNPLPPRHQVEVNTSRMNGELVPVEGDDVVSRHLRLELLVFLPE